MLIVYCTMLGYVYVYSTSQRLERAKFDTETGSCGIKVCYRLSLASFRSTYHFSVVFRMVVFRPFASEVILARVKSSDEDGIRCTFTTSISMSLPEQVFLIFSICWILRRYVHPNPLPSTTLRIVRTPSLSS